MESLSQDERALMRERFLNVLKFMENRNVEIETYKGARINGEFRSTDYNFSNFHVHNLNTPIGIVPEALIRSSDVVSIKFALEK